MSRHEADGLGFGWLVPTAQEKRDKERADFIDLSALNGKTPALQAAFWIQAEILRVNQGKSIICPSRKNLAEIIEREFSK